VARLDQPSRAGRCRRFHRRAYPALLGVRARGQGHRMEHEALPSGGGALPRQARDGGRSRLAEQRRALGQGQGQYRQRGQVPAPVDEPGPAAEHRLLRHGGLRPAVEAPARGRRRRALGHLDRGPGQQDSAHRHHSRGQPVDHPVGRFAAVPHSHAVLPVPPQGSALPGQAVLRPAAANRHQLSGVGGLHAHHH